MIATRGDVSLTEASKTSCAEDTGLMIPIPPRRPFFNPKHCARRSVRAEYRKEHAVVTVQTMDGSATGGRSSDYTINPCHIRTCT